jgi:hypothetical protein
VRSFHIHEGEPIDEELVTSWIEQHPSSLAKTCSRRAVTAPTSAIARGSQRAPEPVQTLITSAPFPLAASPCVLRPRDRQRALYGTMARCRGDDVDKRSEYFLPTSMRTSHATQLLI